MEDRPEELDSDVKRGPDGEKPEGVFAIYCIGAVKKSFVTTGRPFFLIPDQGGLTKTTGHHHVLEHPARDRS